MREQLDNRVTVVAVLSWMRRGIGAKSATIYEREYGVRIPHLYDGPITAIVPRSPTSVIFARNGKAVAWKSGPADWAGSEVARLMRALIHERP
jgi:hypothetical protein